jgi:Tol biopolymer transport system component
MAASPSHDELAISLTCRNGREGIDVIDLSTMERRQVATGTATTPSWSPDGRQIVFARSTDGMPDNFHLFVVNADGSGELQLSDQAYLFPLWVD